jgi:DNA replication and repair protein RecF
MHLTHLSLTNVRNFIRLEVDLPPGPTLLVGANAQGKTSLLEAVYVLARAASPHAGHDRELINFLALETPEPFARLVGEARAQDRLQRIEVRLVLRRASAAEEPQLRKDVLVNGVRQRTRSHAGGLSAVIFMPQDLRVVEGPPAERRRYLDSAIAQADPAYAESLALYTSVLSQRNALLRQLQEANGQAAARPGRAAADQLEAWDEQLAEPGAAVLRARALALAELERLAAPIHGSLTRGGESLRLDYLPSYDPRPRPAGQLDLPLEAPLDRTAVPLAAIRAGLLRTLAERRADDIARGATTTGPHRDEIRLRASGIDLRTYGSRGQNRTAMLSLKLAEVDWIRQRTGEWPVLLLDEVLAELDVERRGALLERALQAEQALLTGADPAMFGEAIRSQASVWRVVSGRLETLDAPG